MIRSVFITKPIAEVELLKQFCEKNGMQLTGNSFIQFKLVKAEIQDEIKTIFFGSKRAFDFFLTQSDIPENCEIACIGKTTKKYIEESGFQVSFCGEKAGNPAAVAEELKVWLGNRKLHIALSAQSNRSMSKVLPKDQVEEIIVYQTLSNPQKTDKIPDVLVFTSPSNLKGFLVENTISPSSTMIAWGETTKTVLMEMGNQPDFVMQDSTEDELINILQNLLPQRSL